MHIKTVIKRYKLFTAFIFSRSEKNLKILTL